MAKFRASTIGNAVALGLLLGSFALSVASCEAGYEQEAEERIGEEGEGEEGGEEGEEGEGEE